MINRVDDYKNQLVKDIQAIEKEIEEIKTRQFIGSSSIQTYKNQTGNTWDVNVSDTWIAPQTQKIHNYAVTFEADTQDAPMNQLSFYTEINGVASGPQAFTKLNQSPVFLNSILHDFFLVYAGLPQQPGLDGFYFATISYVSGTNIRIKFTVHSTDTGTIRLVEI